MRITDVDAQTVEIGRRFGESSTVKQADTSTSTLVRLRGDDGSTGIGEMPDIETPDSMPSDEEIEAQLESFLVGEDPRRINNLTRRMYDQIDFGPFNFHSFQQLALGAVDTALYDLVGHYYEIPAYQLLGGRTQDVPICWVAFTRRSSDEIDALTEEIEEKVDQGFEAFKLKVGEADLETDEERIQTVREIAGEDAQIFLDAQGVWTLEDARENIARFESLGIDGVETPVGHPDRSVSAPGYYYDIPLLPEDIATLKAETDVPLIEHVLDPAFGVALAAHDAVDVFTVEVCAGGLNRAQRILAIAEGAGIDARLGSTVELGPGTAAAASLAAGSPAVTYPSDLIGVEVYADTVLENPPAYRDGYLRMPEAPGFGFTAKADIF